MVDRNRTDRPREENLEQQYMQGSRGVESRNVNIERDGQDDYQRRVYEKADSGFFSTVGKIAAAGFGIYALGKAVPRDLMIDALDKLGARGKEVFKRALTARDNLIYGGPVSREIGTRSELGSFLQNQVDPLLADIAVEGVTGAGRGVALNELRRTMRGQFSVASGVSSRYNQLTAGDILRMGRTNPKQAFSVIGEEAYRSLERASAALDPSGSLFDNIRIDKGLYRDATGIKDTRWASGESIMGFARGLIDRKMPFLGFSPYEVFKPLVQLASKGQTTGIVAGGQKLAEGVEAPRTGLNYVIGGKLFNFQGNKARAIAPGRKFTVQEAGPIGEAYMAMMGRHPLQAIGRTPAKGGFLERALDVVGIGKRYRTSASIVGMPKVAAERRKALEAGTLSFAGHERVKVKSLPFAERLKLEKKLGSAYSDDLIVDNPYFGKKYSDLPFAERVKLLASEGDLGALRDSSGKQLHTDGLFGSRTVSTKKMYGTRAVRPDEMITRRVSGVDIHGMESARGRAGGMGPPRITMTTFGMEDTIGSRLSTAMTFATTRLNQLIGATTGLGIRPSSGRFAGVKNALKIGMLGILFNPFGGVAVDAVKYVNYVFERATGIAANLATAGTSDFKGVGPLDLALSGYKYATLGMAHLKDMTGVTATSKKMEELMPGSMDSPLSGMARTIIPSAILAKTMGGAGILAGLGLSVLTGGVSDIMGPSNVLGAGSTTSAEELSAQYSGEKKVAIKNSRWWMLGRSAFQGEGINRYEKHWLAQQESDWEYSSALYGSKANYFAHASKLPTLHNMFGLGGDDQYFAKMHAQDRPYPVMPDGSMNPMAGMSIPPVKLPKGITEKQLEAIGMAPPEAQTVEPVSEESFGIRAKKNLNVATEFLGIYKFLGETVFGRQETGPVLASADAITDQSRMYWDSDLGGMFGMTELLRRYMPNPNDIGITEKINDIPNMMPGFMPGSRSMFPEDRSYFMDFTVGDPYTKVKGGEYRLPGAGYEAMNELHSGQKGVYDPVDALMILADVAPYSASFKYFDQIVEKMDLAPEWKTKVEEAKQQRQDVLKGYSIEFAERKFTNEYQLPQAEPTTQELVQSSSLGQTAAANETLQYNALEKQIGKGYERLTLDTLPAVGKVVPFGGILTNKLFPHFTAEEDYYQRQVMGAKFNDWADPLGTYARPKMQMLYNEDPLTAGLGGAAIGFSFLGGTPMGQIAGAGLGGISMTAASASRALQYGQIEGGFKPGFREKEEKAYEYFDMLEFARYENAKNVAQDAGRYDIAQEFTRLQSTRTVVGMNVSNPMYAMGAVPKPERFYVDAFSKAQGQDRERILNMVPSIMQDFYVRSYEKGIQNRNPEERVDAYFEQNNMPDESWGGWNPGVQKWQIMSNTMDTADNSVAIDMHRQHVSTSMSRMSANQYPGIGLDQSYMSDNSDWIRTANMKAALLAAGVRQGITDMRVSSTTEPSFQGQPHHNVRLEHRRTRNFRKYQERAEQ